MVCTVTNFDSSLLLFVRLRPHTSILCWAKKCSRTNGRPNREHRNGWAKISTIQQDCVGKIENLFSLRVYGQFSKFKRKCYSLPCLAVWRKKNARMWMQQYNMMKQGQFGNYKNYYSFFSECSKKETSPFFSRIYSSSEGSIIITRIIGITNAKLTVKSIRPKIQSSLRIST